MKKTIILGLILLIATTMVRGFEVKRIEKSKILEDKEWEAIYNDYDISQYKEKLESANLENVKIDVYLAFWCGDSKENLPKFLKIIDALDQTQIEVNFYTCERKPSRDTKFYVEEFQVERIPTFIFYRNNQEFGRIIEQPIKSMAEDFIEIILKN